MALEFYKKRVANLESDLSNTKIFLNMVIQDMQSPIKKFSFAINKGLISISKALLLLNKYEDDHLNCMMFFQSQHSKCKCKNLNPNELRH